MKLLILIMSCTVSQYVWAAEVTDGCDYEEIVIEIEVPYVP